LREKPQLEDLCAYGRVIIKMDLKKTVGQIMKGTHLAHDRDQWWALVNRVMKFWAP
jgi:hypothetical protein